MVRSFLYDPAPGITVALALVGDGPCAYVYGDVLWYRQRGFHRDGGGDRHGESLVRLQALPAHFQEDVRTRRELTTACLHRTIGYREGKMERKRVLVEMLVPHKLSARRVRKLADRLTSYGFDMDPDYVVPLEGHDVAARKGRYRRVLLRGRVEEGREPELEADPDVVRVWADAPIVPFGVPEGEVGGGPRKSPFAF